MPFQVSLVYHEGYDLQFGDHVFPTQKYRLIRERLIREGHAGEAEFLKPEPVSYGQLLLVHDEEWIRKLRTGTLTYHDIVKLEVPYSSRMVDAFLLAAGGTLLAARKALERGGGFNIGGGFHHAFAGHGEGFCAINDVAIAARALLAEKRIHRALIVDCDVHHGNGTAAIFAGARDVVTFSIHQHRNYPHDKPPSTVDIHLADGTGDDEYLERLAEGLAESFKLAEPELVLYVAGADPFEDDQLGGLALTKRGLLERDRAVFRMARGHGAAVAVTLAGGYSRRVEDTVDIHTQTAIALAESLGARDREG